MDFEISPEHRSLMVKVDGFVQDRLIPLEQDPKSFDEHENVREDLLQTLRAEVKAMGLFCHKCLKNVVAWGSRLSVRRCSMSG